MNHPDFRVGGKVFATLAYPDKSWAMVKLTPEQQHTFVRNAPDAFRPCTGAWGQRGATNIHLISADTPLVQASLDAAYQNLAALAKKAGSRQRR